MLKKSSQSLRFHMMSSRAPRAQGYGCCDAVFGRFYFYNGTREFAPGAGAVPIVTPHVVESLVRTCVVSIELSLFRHASQSTSRAPNTYGFLGGRSFNSDRQTARRRLRYKRSQSAAILCETRLYGPKPIENGPVK